MRAVAFLRSTLRAVGLGARRPPPPAGFALPAWSFRLSRVAAVRR